MNCGPFGEEQMAIRILPFHAIVLRPFVSQDITQSGWRMLVLNAAGGLFDGEIMAFGSMDFVAIRGLATNLEGAGFKGPVQGGDADFTLQDRGEGLMPRWLQKVVVKYFDESGVSAAWKMVGSEVYTLHDRSGRPHHPTKGYEVDWEPFIGKIG